ncbi:hypothetical protein DV736_g4863, partial [Chaetothyriales sp. CBS 134916]
MDHFHHLHHLHRELAKRKPQEEVTQDGTVYSVVYVTASPTFTGIIGGYTTLTEDPSTQQTEASSSSQALSAPAVVSSAAPSSYAVETSSSGMSTAAKAGLAIGIIAAIGLLAAFLLWLLGKKRRQREENERTNNEKPAFDVSHPTGPVTQTPPSAANGDAPRLSLRPMSRMMDGFLGGSNRRSGNLLNSIDEDRRDPEHSRGPTPFSKTPFAATIAQQVEPQYRGSTEADRCERLENHLRSPSPEDSLPIQKPLSPEPSREEALTPTPDFVSAPSIVAAALPSPALSGKSDSPPGGNVYRVLMDFSPSMDDELELKTGQLIRLLHEYDDGWALCIRLDRSQQGVVPRTCLAAKPSKPKPSHLNQYARGPGPHSRPMSPAGASRPMSPANRNGRSASPGMGRPMSPGMGRSMSPDAGRPMGPLRRIPGRPMSPAQNPPMSPGAFNQAPRPLSPGPRPYKRSESPGPYGVNGPTPMHDVEQRRRSNSASALGARERRTSPLGPSNLGPASRPFGQQYRPMSPGIALAKQIAVHGTRSSVQPTAATREGAGARQTVRPRPLTSTSSTGLARSRSVADRSVNRPVTGPKPALATGQQHPNFPNLLPDARSSSTARPNRSGPSSEMSSCPGRLRDELLQLSLVHARSHETLEQYTSCARSKLEARAARIKREEVDVSALEAKRQEGLNISGLFDWVGKLHPYSASEQVRNLSFAIQQLATLTHPNGDFTHFVEEFDKWLNDSEDCIDLPTDGTVLNHADVSSSKGLDASWEQSVEALKTRVCFCQTAFRQAGPLDERSAIGKIISGHTQLADAVMHQLVLCTRLRSSVLSRQKNRISHALEQRVREAGYMPAAVMDDEVSRPEEKFYVDARGSEHPSISPAITTGPPESMGPDSSHRETTESRIRVHQDPLSSYPPTTSYAGSPPVLKHRLTSAADISSDALPDRPEKRMRLDSRGEHEEAESWRLGAVPPAYENEWFRQIRHGLSNTYHRSSEFMDHDLRSSCSNCHGTEDLLGTIVQSLFDLQSELSRLMPSELLQKATEINPREVTTQGLKHSLNWSVQELRNSIRALQGSLSTARAGSQHSTLAVSGPSHLSSSASQAAQASHLQDLQHQISTKTLALQTLQKEHDQLLAAFSRSQIRCNTLDKKSQVSDHEINTLTEEKIRLYQQVESLEAQVEELQKSRDEVHKQSSADGAQWRQIMAMSSQLQVKSAEEARRFRTEREAWEQDKASLQRRIQDLEEKHLTASTLALPSAVSDSSSTVDDALTSMSVEALRQEVLKLRARCAELELSLQGVSGETELLDRAISAMSSIKQRLAHSNTKRDDAS